MDTLSRGERSKRMALIRGKNTKPELFVRRIIKYCGPKCRYHAADLPGKPDFIFPTIKKVIFVHGCFWHRHPNCALARMPKSRLLFWESKLNGNRLRDIRNISRLRRERWGVLVVWECQLKKYGILENRIRKFLRRKNAKR
jgi:DNA mismatch endonuclease (patch repair protein)